ncbi:transcription repressor NadR [Metabacillus arenae]|uniref:Transcription repressor NadR n=1 Tax=Metabacillus arenae TaxID=2771434 RepID=A0A926S1P8_9BACI|nr:transcription repressor NadR [Metabacillus arenae]MBD1381214.1 transcription repressor NadR [Metabacillus arenae]
MKEKKILGDERRALLLQWLKETTYPLTGSDLAKKTNVSRQVIVQDVSLLKAQNEPIIATSQGYLYLRPKGEQDKTFERIIASRHSPEDAEKELNLIVDHGVTVLDVTIEHPVYGDLKASIHVSNRKEVKEFFNKMRSTNAALLSQLTDGLHLHTLVASSDSTLDEVCTSLDKAGFLVH